MDFPSSGWNLIYVHAEMQIVNPSCSSPIVSNSVPRIDDHFFSCQIRCDVRERESVRAGNRLKV